MEIDEHGFLEELLALRRDTWESFPTEMNELFSNGGSFDWFQENPSLVSPNSSLEGFSVSNQPTFDSSLNDVYCPFFEGVSVPKIESSSRNPDTVTFNAQEDYGSVMVDEEPGLVSGGVHNSVERQGSCKLEVTQATETPVFKMGSSCVERKKMKKVVGQPSKNLMAERRRRKRLNDRLAMLRSVVPKISKMDRTSILGDTIDYMKELLDRIKSLQEGMEIDPNQLNLLSIFKEIKPNEIFVRNTPKFDVERRSMDTRIEICCAAKPGLLLSTVTTLEGLGLEIEQCVISCFNDFGMQASCSEDLEHRRVISSEEIRNALFKNAGYGGGCL